MQWLLNTLPDARLHALASVGFPVTMLLINFPLLDLGDDDSVRVHAEHVMAAIPADAVVIGHWWDIVPLQYLQLVEDQRPDLALRNAFLFDTDTYDAFPIWHF